ncbi:MAG: hypothetical protein AB7E79_09625 [Rhodospirillaceae bacterium]
MKADARALAKIHTMTVRAAAKRTKEGIQRQIRQNFGDADQLKGAIKLQSNPPRGNSMKTTVRVYSKARYQRSHGRRTTAIDLLELYSRSEVVHAANKKWLAIPTKNAPWVSGRGGQRRAQPSETGHKFTFIRSKSEDRAYLVTTEKNYRGAGVLMYVLVRMTRRQQRLDPDRAHRESLQKVSADLQRFFLKEDARMRREFGAGISTGDR